MTATEIISCPRCGEPLDDEQYCPAEEVHISDAEIAAHQAIWGDVWDV